MSVTLVARKEFRDAIRSRVLLGLTILFVAFVGGGVVLTSQFPAFGAVGDSTVPSILIGLISPAALFVPVIAILIGYGAIAGERESGSIYTLLGLSHSRADVVAGKIAGRSCVVAVSILAGFAVGAVALYAVSGTVRPVQYLVFTAATFLLGVAYVSIAVAVSATTGSTTRAAWGAFATFVFLNFLWEPIGFLLYFLTSGSTTFELPFPEWLVFFVRLSPASAYQVVATAAMPAGHPLLDGFRAILGAGSDPPLFLESWVAVGILLLWIVLPTAAGYAQFRRTEL
ncbi:ABC transporter permease [Halosimplex salinum]|uniref:ABC transporter permease n=1 Tax=Halosimplex salinum TaxID=1710538 RepID=UPI000F49CEC3|nr:ABC transporter permease [Halosimplex salinum]